MKCLECRYMACKQFFFKTEIWTGFCLNPNSPRSRTCINGTDGCECFKNENHEEKTEMDLFNNILT